jgi:tRNA A-37 threonylcarbamoyl transferase component Bud32/tetratricopeptide (TPR) repeat protein
MARPGPETLDALLDQQSRSWLSGKRPAIEELLDGYALRNDSEAQLDLIYNEIVLREQLGEHPSAEEYFARYPHLKDPLALHFEVHRAIGDDVLTETAKLPGHATSPDAAAKSRPALPQPGGYEIVRLLGRGGMGVVYKARHEHLRRFVALKMFEPGRVPSEREVLRFHTEAATVARLQHPNIVQIFEIGQRDGLPFLALELVEGGTLADRLQRLTFAPRAAAELLETLARAVHHAHTHGVIHRDLKPANVLFTRPPIAEHGADGRPLLGTPKLTDFGLAKVLEEEPDGPRDATRTGEPIGTPRYMAPEQAAGRHDRIGPATDVYALGTLLYECLTGRVPFVSASVIETLDRIRSDEPLSPRRLQPSIPRDLATICLYCLNKDPGRRYASALALADDLRRFLKGEPIMARPTPVWEQTWKWCRRHPTHAALGAVGVLLLVSGITAAGVWNHLEERRIASERDRVEVLVAEGQEALARDDEARAEARFREAWEIVQGEPALRDYQTGVSGWLDHARRSANKHRWNQRVPPPEYPERRDEAFYRSLLLEPEKIDSLKSARESIAVALDLTLPNDPAWKPERERLAVLEADVLLAGPGPDAALARLEREGPGSSRLFHARRAVCLERLDRRAEADAARREAERFPPEEQAARLFAGMERVRRRDFVSAARDFEGVLDAEPEHFAARLFLAVCAMQQNRPGEAKVGLTACIAQRPYCACSYQLRGRCEEQLGNATAARRDFDRAAELRLARPNS